MTNAKTNGSIDQLSKINHEQACAWDSNLRPWKVKDGSGAMSIELCPHPTPTHVNMIANSACITITTIKFLSVPE